MPSSTGDVCLYILAIFIPPLAVLVKRGCGADVLINILLTLLWWLPGVIHAWWVISKHEKRARVVQARAVEADAKEYY